MRICLVSLDYKPFRSSGLTVYAEDLAKGLSELGHSITVFAAKRSGVPIHHYIEGIEIYRVPSDRLDWISFSFRAARLIRHLQKSNSWDIIHFLDVHFAYAFHSPYVASLWQSFHQRLTAQDGQPYNSGNLDRLRRQLYYRIARSGMEKPCLSRAGILIASCQSTFNEFVQNYRVPPQRINLVYQGIDLSLFRPVDSSDLRQRLGLNNLRLILFVGFMTPRKGLEYLGEALHKLPNDIHLLIVGRWEAGYRKVFMKSVGPAIERVHESGYIKDEDRPAYYSLADVYVSPSILEGFGITPIEAMACGTPAIVTDASSGPEEVGEAGIVVPARDPDKLAAAILSLVENDQLRSLKEQEGRERVRKLFSRQRMAELTLNCYERYLSSV